LPDRFDERDRFAAQGAAKAHLLLIGMPVFQVRHQVDAEAAAGFQHAMRFAQRGLQVIVGQQRLQNAVRRHDPRE